MGTFGTKNPKNNKRPPLLFSPKEYISWNQHVYFHIVSYLCHPETFEYNRRLRRITEKSDKSKRRSWENYDGCLQSQETLFRWADLCEEEFAIEGSV